MTTQSNGPLGPLEIVALYCGCGAIFEGTLHRAVRGRFVLAWRDAHAGPSHGETNARGAWMAALHQQALAEDRCRSVGAVAV